MVLRNLALIILSLLTAKGACLAATPEFNDFSKPIISRQIAKVKIVSKQDRLYRSILTQADLRHPTFADHYVLVEFGCGTLCVQAAAIDTQSGRVSWLPFTVSGPVNAPLEWKPLSYRADSALLVVDGIRNEHGSDGKHFYAFRNGRFDEIAGRH